MKTAWREPPSASSPLPNGLPRCRGIRHPAHEIFYDPLALPISTGIEEDRRNGCETIEAIRRITTDLPGVHVVLGVSNISFGLSPAARITLNSVFLHDCCEAGMDAAIVSPAKSCR